MDQPQIGEIRRGASEIVQWDGKGWKQLQSPTYEAAQRPTEATEADMMHAPSNEQARGIWNQMSPDEQKAVMDRGFQRSVGGEGLLMGSAVPIANLIGKGVGMLRTAASSGALRGAAQGAVEGVPGVGRIIRGARLGAERAVRNGGTFGPSATESAAEATKPWSQMTPQEVLDWARSGEHYQDYLDQARKALGK